jgi:hypothetical protein
MQAAWAEAVQRLEALGGQAVADFDFAPFAETAVLLYGAAFVAERYAGEPGGTEPPAITLSRCLLGRDTLLDTSTCVVPLPTAQLLMLAVSSNVCCLLPAGIRSFLESRAAQPLAAGQLASIHEDERMLKVGDCHMHVCLYQGMAGCVAAQVTAHESSSRVRPRMPPLLLLHPAALPSHFAARVAGCCLPGALLLTTLLLTTPVCPLCLVRRLSQVLPALPACLPATRSFDLSSARLKASARQMCSTACRN